MQKYTVFWLFAFNIATEEKCHIYHFVEQVKLYRLVYDLIWTVQKFEGKDSQKQKAEFFCIFWWYFLGWLRSVDPSEP